MGKHSNKRPRQVVEQQTVSIASVHRLVARVQIKDRIKFLEDIIKTHQPLVQAMKVTQKAYQEGVMEGIRQVAAAEREREANLAKQGVQSEVTPTESFPTVLNDLTQEPPITCGVENCISHIP